MRTRSTIATVLCLLGLAVTSPARPGGSDPWLWTEKAQLNTVSGHGYSYFGHSVALDGDAVLIGAPLEQGTVGFPGAAYVYVRSGETWIAEAQLVPSDPGHEDWFGFSVALQGDTALVGAPFDDDAGDRSGSVYVFVRSGGLWTQTAKLTAPDAGPDDHFGRSIAIGGNALLIGAPYQDTAAGANAGSCYLFIGSGASWTMLQKLEASNGDDIDYFGGAVALSGTTALIGADLAQGGAWATGAAYVFTKYGGAWHEQAKLHASDGANYDRFGWSVALDGDRALIGAPEDELAGTDTGAAYVFERSGSTWSQKQKLVASDPGALEKYGAAVALEGGTAMVSASNSYSSSGPGGIYVYHLQGVSWSEMEKLTQPSDDWFGRELALDGHRMVTGDPALDPGYVYVYERPPEAGFGYCYGDPGSGTPCPCSNDNDGSIPGSGCDNGVFASGAQLVAYGEPSVAADEVFLRTTHVEPYNSGLYFQGNNLVNGGAGVVFGDGLRCAGGQVKRLQVRFADEQGTTRTTVALAQKGGVTPGDVRTYQYWYRTTAAPPCGLWVNDFNTSNGYSITWTP